ncbi:MAG: hypothetical protein JWO42_1527 [Chloroflexi bacterium]|nr:hypothetical protein [Chloroflexota bacterium]
MLKSYRPDHTACMKQSLGSRARHGTGRFVRVGMVLAVLSALLGALPSNGLVHASQAIATLTATPVSAPADGATPINVTVRVADGSGVGIAGIAVHLVSDHPETVFTQPLTSTDVLGQASGSITSKAGGQAAISAVDGSGAVLGTTVVSFIAVPAPGTAIITSAILSHDPGSAGHMPTTTTRVSVVARDYRGQPMVGRQIQLRSSNPLDRIIQPVVADNTSTAAGTVTFTGTATVLSAVDVATGTVLGSVSLAGSSAGSTNPGGLTASILLSSDRMGNGMDTVSALVTVRDSTGKPVAGRKLMLQGSAVFVTFGPPAITDAAGTARFVIRMTRGNPHYGSAAGPVAISVVDVGSGKPLPGSAKLTVYNRVVVLLPGFGTSLSCSIADCHDQSFGQVSHDILAPIGYNLNGTGLQRTELEYSYRGGSMVRDPSGAWQWLVKPYRACDTSQSLAASDAALRTLLQNYRARYPYTMFELVAHSLGGVIALDTLAGDGGEFLRSHGPVAVDKVVTIDSPINGIAQSLAPIAPLVLGGLLGGIPQIQSCTSQLAGTFLVGGLIRIGTHQPARQDSWVATLRRAGVELLTITNRNDLIVPESFAVIDDGSRRHVSDRMRFTVGIDRTAGHGTLMSRHLDNGVPNPAWPEVIATLQGYLTNPCLPLAGNASACPYPSINRGF